MRTIPVAFEPSDATAIASNGRLRALAEALAALNPLSAPHDAVARLLCRTAIEATDLLPYVTLDARRYTRNRLLRTGEFELLALCWPAGARSSIHDHGGSRCFVRLIDGSLASEDFAIVSGGREPGPVRLRPLRTHQFVPGDVDARTAAQDIHRLSALGGPAISLHVYARPLDTFLMFDTQRQVCRRVQAHDDR